MANELREILEKLQEKVSIHLVKQGCIGCSKCKIDIDQATTEIKSLLKSKLPEKVIIEELKSKPCPYSDKIKCCTMQDYSKNEILTEIEKIVEGL